MEYLVTIFLLGFIVALFLYNWYRKRNRQKRIARGIQLENDAAYFLKKKGFVIIHKHFPLQYTLEIDAKKQVIKLEADYIVSKHNRTLLVEVKSGEHTAHILYAPTRRQLLEYYCASEFDGYLLVDMHHKTITEIEFPFKKKSKKNQGGVIGGLIVLGGAVCIDELYIRVLLLVFACVLVYIGIRKKT